MPASTPAAPIALPRSAFPALIAANLILALGPVFVRLADVGPVAAAFWRLTLALPFLFAMAWPALRRQPPRPAEIGVTSVAGVVFAGDLAAWHLGIVHTKVANATLFGNMSALILPLWGLIILRHRASRVQIFALLLAAAGAAALMGSSYELSPDYMLGDLLCLLAGCFYAAYLLLVQGARRRMGSWPVLSLASAASSPALLITAALLGERIMPGNWTPVILLALSSQVIGQGLLTWAVGWFSPLVLGLSLLVQPVVAALVGWLMFGEWLTPADMLGGIAVAGALVLVRLPVRA